MRYATSLILLSSFCFGAVGKTLIMPPMVPSIATPTTADSNTSAKINVQNPVKPVDVNTTKIAVSPLAAKSAKDGNTSISAVLDANRTNVLKADNNLSAKVPSDANASKQAVESVKPEAKSVAPAPTALIKPQPLPIQSTMPTAPAQFAQPKKPQKEPISLNINGLEIADFVRMVSNIMGQNILVSSSVKGKIEFISVKPIYKEDLYDLLINVLENYGYTIVDSGKGYLNVIRATEAAQMNLPFMQESDIPQMVTEVLAIKHGTADAVTAKVRHLASKNAKILVSKENNSLIISDYAKNIDTIRKVVTAIDTRDQATTQYNHVVPLKNSDSKTLVTTLNNVISKKVLKPGELRASVTSDDSNNALIVTATDEEFSDIKKTIDLLDGEQKQVYVKAKIVEISENKSTEIGIKYGIVGGMANNSGLFTLGSKLTGNAINVDQTILGYMNKSKVTTNVTTGVTTTEPGAIDNALSGAKSVLALGVSLSFLGENGAANVLSEPSLLCLNNQESSIYVGKTKSINAGTSVTSTGISQTNFTRQDIGLSLKIKPRVSSDQRVSLQVDAKLEDVDVADTAENATQPTTTKREVKTTTVVQNGESVIIGGLIKDKKDTAVSQLPLLGDIPLLGYLFKNEKKSVDKINLVIVLTPYIVEKSADLNKLRKQLEELDKLQEEYIKQALKK